MKNFNKLIDIRQTPSYAKFMVDNGWDTITTKRDINIFSKKIPWTPFYTAKALRYHQTKKENLNKSLRPLTTIFKNEPFECTDQSIKTGSVYFKISPDNSWPLTPTKTIWINLDQPLQSIKQHLKAKNRYNLKRTKTKFNLDINTYNGSEILKERNNQTLNYFYKLWAYNKPHNFLFRPSEHQLTSLIKSFQNNSFIVTAKLIKGDKHQEEINDNPIIAAALILYSPNMSFYWHNASSDLGKQLYAPTRVVWESIKESKKRNLKIFDFEGVWDERYPKLNSGWKGFSKFKHSFINQF